MRCLVEPTKATLVDMYSKKVVVDRKAEKLRVHADQNSQYLLIGSKGGDVPGMMIKQRLRLASLLVGVFFLQEFDNFGFRRQRFDGTEFCAS
jgi:hypothetical protein